MQLKSFLMNWRGNRLTVHRQYVYFLTLWKYIVHSNKLIHDRAPLYHSNVSFKRPASDRMDYIATNAYWWNFLARNWHAWLLARISTLKSVENLKQSNKSIVSSTDIKRLDLVAWKQRKSFLMTVDYIDQQ